jgi:hypothetical protein
VQNKDDGRLKTTAMGAGFGMRLENSLLLAVILVFQTSCLTVKDIPGINNNHDVAAIALNIRTFAEPYAQRWMKSWGFPVSRDSVKHVLYTAIRQIDSLIPHYDTPELLLMKGVAWHYLYQLEVDSAFAQSDRITTIIIKTHPELIEASWLKAVNLIRATRIREGFVVMDRVRNAALLENHDFLFDYAELSALCFLPKGFARQDILSAVLSTRPGEVRLKSSEKSLDPDGETWRVAAQTSYHDALPVFTFGTECLVHVSPMLSFPLLIGSTGPRLSMNLDRTAIGTVSLPLIYDPDASEFPVEIRIIADCTRPVSSLSEFMFSVVNNKYDMIRNVSRPRNPGTISLRCYATSAIRSIPDEFCAFVAFETISRMAVDCFYRPAKKAPLVDRVPVRYLIAMKTRRPAEAKAEAMLESMIGRFSGATD